MRQMRCDWLDRLYVSCVLYSSLINKNFSVSLQQCETPTCAVCVCVGRAVVGLPVISNLLPFDLRQPRAVGQSAARTEVERLLGHPVPSPVERDTDRERER